MRDDLYRTLFENAPIALALADADGHLLAVNKALELALGNSLEEILTSRPDKERWHEIRIEGNPHRIFEILTQPIESGPASGQRILVFREATTERALQESEEKYRQLFSNELEAISIFDPKTGQILDVNDAYLKLYGYSKDEILNMTVAGVSAEPDETMRAVQETLATSGDARILVRWHKKQDGTVFPVELYASTFEWKGQPVMCAMIRDITERMEAEHRRIALALERERVKILAGFITQASHEFKTPLSIINTSTYLLGRATDPENREGRIRQIEFQVENLTALVNKLITMATLDSGEHLTHAQLDVNEIIRHANQSLQSSLVEAELHTVLNLDEQPLLVWADSNFLQQAIEHIWHNAIRYTQSGGTITVRSRADAENVVIEISDTGVGIGENVRGRIFERFYRADETGTTRGFGLGLPIAKAIIEEHDGRIDVESELGKGSTFTILLPITQAGLGSSANH